MCTYCVHNVTHNIGDFIKCMYILIVDVPTLMRLVLQHFFRVYSYIKYLSVSWKKVNVEFKMTSLFI